MRTHKKRWADCSCASVAESRLLQGDQHRKALLIHQGHLHVTLLGYFRNSIAIHREFGVS